MVEILENVFVEKEVAERLELDDYREALEIALEDERIDRELRAWLRTPEAKADINYSDIYKDVHGVRPWN